MDNEYSLDRDNIVLICLMFHFSSDNLIQTGYIITNTVLASAVHKTYLALGLITFYGEGSKYQYVCQMSTAALVHEKRRRELH